MNATVCETRTCGSEERDNRRARRPTSQAARRVHRAASRDDVEVTGMRKIAMSVAASIPPITMRTNAARAGAN